MNLENNNQIQKASTGASGRIQVVAAIAILLCAAVVAAIIFKGTPARTAVVPVVQGGLINAEPQSNTTTAAVPLPPQVPAVVVTPGNVPAPVAASPVINRDGYAPVGFEKLAGFTTRLHWEMVDAIRIKGVQKLTGDVPADIKSLDNSKIAVRGFMLPLKLEDGLATEFLLMRTQARCCYGLPIQANEVLTVHMAKPGVKSLMDQPVTVYGRLHLSETRDGNGALTSIYTLDGDKMDLPQSL